MAPVSRKRNPSRAANPRAAVLFPAPAGPSMVTIMVGISSPQKAQKDTQPPRRKDPIAAKPQPNLKF
jgi:hypothetical protein